MYESLVLRIGGVMLAGKLKYSEKNLFHCHFVHHKLQMGWHGIEPDTHFRCLNLQFFLENSYGFNI